MLFNTIDFIIFLILILLLIAVIKNQKYHHLVLLVGSYFFFYYSSNYLILLLIFSTVFDFYIAKKIYFTQNKLRKKILLITSLIANIGLLGFFKYADFGIAQFNIFGNYFDFADTIPFLYIAVPIGISFYTFQTISYTVDVYRGSLEPSKSLKEFALFIAFFPQLVAGPILRAKDFLPQIRVKIQNAELEKYGFLKDSNLKLGVTIIGFGFMKKMLFADNISPLVDQVFVNPVGMESFSIILATIGFGIQIYADFSGYSDIAIGIATILGFKIPRNFNRPYIAISIQDFWKRWHISLSTWLRDYLYIPLGGNKKSQSITYLNLMIVMFIGGLWHGASWSFVIWGVLHGIYLTINKFVEHKFPKFVSHPYFSSKIGKITLILFVQYFIFLAWIPFRVQNIEFVVYSIQKYVFWDFATSNTIQLVVSNKISVVLIIIFIITCVISQKKNMYEIVAKLSLSKWALILIGFTISILLLYDGHPQDFIYFKF